MRIELTSEQEILLAGLLESERQQWKQALYTIALETSDKTYKGLCETKIQEIEGIQRKMKATSKEQKTQQALADLKTYLEGNERLAEIVNK